jgi:hypothetical protein
MYVCIYLFTNQNTIKILVPSNGPITNVISTNYGDWIGFYELTVFTVNNYYTF